MITRKISFNSLTYSTQPLRFVKQTIKRILDPAVAILQDHLKLIWMIVMMIEMKIMMDQIAEVTTVVNQAMHTIVMVRCGNGTRRNIDTTKKIEKEIVK